MKGSHNTRGLLVGLSISSPGAVASQACFSRHARGGGHGTGPIPDGRCSRSSEPRELHDPSQRRQGLRLIGMMNRSLRSPLTSTTSNPPALRRRCVRCDVQRVREGASERACIRPSVRPSGPRSARLPPPGQRFPPAFNYSCPRFGITHRIVMSCVIACMLAHNW